MSRLRAQLELAGRMVFVTVALSGIAFGQTDVGSSLATKDMFSSMRETLSDAADRTLADELAYQTWMKIANPETGPNSASIVKNPVLQIRSAIDRVTQLRPTLEPILRSEGIPVELSAVVIVESGGITTALSPKGARGLWQFMPDTARRYGLVVDGTRDDRLDIAKSTHAAARYLRDLYATFGNWSFALAAYNAGEMAVSNAIKRSGSKDFASIRDNGRLPLETRKYVPSVGAAINRLYYGSAWLDPPEINPQVVYAFSGSGE